MTDKEATQKRTAMLAELRKQQREKVERAQALLKEQQAVRKTLSRVLQGEPRSIPDIAVATNLPPHEVLWHITAMKKYGEVVEDGMDDDFAYYLYRLAKEPIHE
jgi:predicted Rossmann fold nucleotide-binding protein DprA/Smf involved in DNA uptake